MKKTVAVIGAASPFASAISSGLAGAGYPILLTVDQGLHLSLLLVSLPLLLARIKARVPHADVRLVLSARDASWEADIVFPAVPREALAALSRKINDVVTGKILVSLTGRLEDLQDESGQSAIPGAAGELASLFPHSKIVRATVGTVHGSADEPGLAGRVEHVILSGEDQEALSSVAELIRDAGFRTLKGGTLALH